MLLVRELISKPQLTVAVKSLETLKEKTNNATSKFLFTLNFG